MGPLFVDYELQNRMEYDILRWKTNSNAILIFVYIE